MATAGSAGLGGGGGLAGGGSAGAAAQEPCDSLVPSHCSFPFPNDYWTEADDTSPTGKRLALSADMLPASGGGVPTTAAPFNQADGFSASAALLAHLPGATTTGLPSPVTIDVSLQPSSPTLLVDAETGELVPHFSELDVAGSTERQAFMMRPVVRLKDGHRYIAAIQGVVDGDDDLLPPSETFAALRDGSASASATTEARREHFANIFDVLSGAGIEPSTLQLAWDFTTASRQSNTGRLVSMRDQALSASGALGPEYELDVIEQDVDENIALRLEGRMTVPLFLDRPDPGGVLTLDAEGVPRQNGTAEFPFLVLVPRSATTGTPAPVVWYGHGLFGQRYEAETYRQFANEHNYVFVATDWSGMASEDVDPLTSMISGGDISGFQAVADRLQQGIVNALLATRMVGGRLAQDPLLQFNGVSAIDTTEKYYFGASQGGIFGATYLAVSTDVRRGVLAVPGQSYHLLLQRSVNFDPFFTLLNLIYPDELDLQMVLTLAQMLWDRAEPSGYSHLLAGDTLPNTPDHSALLLVSIGDHQVSTLGAHIMARAMGAKNLAPVNRSIFGIEEMSGPFSGTAMIEYDFGLPPEPIVNEPMREGDDPHSRIAEIPSAETTLDTFLRTGVVSADCGGPCGI